MNLHGLMTDGKIAEALPQCHVPGRGDVNFINTVP
jgi:hypothetical protein